MAVTANTPKAIEDTTIKTLNAPVLLSKMRAAMRSQTECPAADKIYEWIYSHATVSYTHLIEKYADELDIDNLPEQPKIKKSKEFSTLKQESVENQKAA